jgi:hypothetical protein
MVFNATFNNISVISWWQFYWWRKCDNPEKTINLLQVRQTLSHNVVSSTHHLSGIKLTTLVVICTDGKGSCKSNYYTIMTTTDPEVLYAISPLNIILNWIRNWCPAINDIINNHCFILWQRNLPSLSFSVMSNTTSQKQFKL